MSSEIKQLVLSLLVLLLLAACGGGPDSESPIATDGTTNAPPTNGADDDNTPPVLSDSAERGKALYNSSIQGCLGCHGADGQSGRFQKIDPTLATYEHSSVVGQGYRLEEYLELWMPVSNPSLCVGECATDIAAYMRSWNTASPEPTPEPAPAPTPNPVPSPIEIRVESEDYDRYYDTTSANEGGEYRQDDVGIGRAIDQGGGYFVGWTARDEWLEYDVTIPASGDYNLELRIATVNVVGNGVIALSIDGQSVEDTVSLPITGDWQGWTSIDIPLGRIEQGQKNIRFSIVNHGINLNWFRLHADIAVPEPTPTPIPTPAPVPVAGDPARGKEIYETGPHGCVACHGFDGQSTAFKAIDPGREFYTHSSQPGRSLTLADYLAQWMPPSATTSCTGDCARDLAAYIRTWQVEGSTPLACELGGTINYGKRQMRLLTTTEYENTLFDLLAYRVDAKAAGVPQDTFVDGFANQVLTAVTQEYADAYASIAKQAASYSANNNFAGVVNCNGLNGQQCANRFVDDFAIRAFRRPLTQAERNRYQSLFADNLTQGDLDMGIQLALETVLTSPFFLMRSELGVAVSEIDQQSLADSSLDINAYVLTPYELATFLAYTYTGSTPDENLLQAAANNQLLTDDQILIQIDRLLSTQKARQHFGEFAAQWLRTDRVLSRSKDANVFPNFTADIRQAMAQEVREIFKHVMFDGEQSIDELYGNFTFVNRNLASYYGISGNFGSNFTKVDNLTDRGGILTSGAFMAGFANLVESSPIQRGVAVREDLMCLEVPPMPNDLGSERDSVAAALEDYINQMGGVISNRERTHFLTKDEPCSQCHQGIINPQGFGMEDFDAVGLVRQVDANGLLIDASGQLIGLSSLSDGQQIGFTGAKGLSTALKGLPATRSCFVEKGFRFVMGTGHDVFDHANPNDNPLTTEQQDAYACTLELMEQAMSDANNNPREAMRTLGVRDIIRYRK